MEEERYKIKIEPVTLRFEQIADLIFTKHAEILLPLEDGEFAEVLSTPIDPIEWRVVF